MVEIFKTGNFRNYGHVICYEWPQITLGILEGVTMDDLASSKMISGSSPFQYGQKNLQNQDFEMLRKNRNNAKLW